jgi:hypothetical protein
LFLHTSAAIACFAFVSPPLCPTAERDFVDPAATTATAFVSNPLGSTGFVAAARAAFVAAVAAAATKIAFVVAASGFAERRTFR